eukprot:GILJ01006926.1.p1 GENE.GILJ01006926.1~~GILJ01006926.1.p1  ORF type:complete len:220 (-),score=25.96 GILJ01006926.1:685-1344(-)
MRSAIFDCGRVVSASWRGTKMGMTRFFDNSTHAAQAELWDHSKRCLRLLPSSVVVITSAATVGNSEIGVAAGEYRGVTVGSFTSVSARGPLVSFNIKKHSKFHFVLEHSPVFAAHIMNENQSHVAEQFARANVSSAEQFKDVSFRVDEHRVPLLDDCLGIMVCRVRSLFPAADHSIVLGEVLDVHSAPTSDRRSPLVYFSRTYRLVSDHVVSKHGMVTN